MPAPTRRPATAQDLFSQGHLSQDKTSMADAERLLAVLNKYDLILTEEKREAYLVRTPKVQDPKSVDDYQSEIYVPTPVFFRICRSTGCWLPGKVSFSGSGDDMICYATCHTRLSVNDAWVEVGAHARKFVYYRREADGQSPELRWEITPDIALAETAEVLAARKAVGELVNDVNVEAVTLEFAVDRRVIKRIEERRRPS